MLHIHIKSKHQYNRKTFFNVKKVLHILLTHITRVLWGEIKKFELVVQVQTTVKFHSGLCFWQ